MTDTKSIPVAEVQRADFIAAGLASLCLVHCLALPLFAAVMPILGYWAEAEWMHQLFVLLALPISGAAIAKRAAAGQSTGLILMTIAGLGLLVAGAFVEALHALEEPLTVAGGVLVAAAHLTWWHRHRLLKGKPRRSP